MLFAACLSGCSKSDDVVAQVKAQATIDDKIVTDYLTANKIPINRVDTTGVCYTIDTLGTGTNLFTSSTQITVSYTGTLLTTGAQFTSSGTTFHPTFILGQVIRGWQLGLPKINSGGVITLYLPSRYAYGPYAQPTLGLPANAILIFNIKLYNIVN